MGGLFAAEPPPPSSTMLQVLFVCSLFIAFSGVFFPGLFIFFVFDLQKHVCNWKQMGVHIKIINSGKLNLQILSFRNCVFRRFYGIV